MSVASTLAAALPALADCCAAHTRGLGIDLERPQDLDAVARSEDHVFFGPPAVDRVAQSLRVEPVLGDEARRPHRIRHRRATLDFDGDHVLHMARGPGDGDDHDALPLQTELVQRIGTPNERIDEGVCNAAEYGAHHQVERRHELVR